MSINDILLDEEDKQPMTGKEFEHIVQVRRYKNHLTEPLVIQKKILVDDIKIGDPQINYGKTIQNLKFEDCCFHGEIKVKASSAGFVTFKDCVFRKPVDIDYFQVDFESTCFFNSDLNILLEKHVHETQISNIIIQGKLIINGSASSLKLENINHNQQIEAQEIIVSAKSKDLFIKHSRCQHLTLSRNIEFDKDIFLEDIQVRRLYIDEIILNGGLNIIHSHIDQVVCTDLKGNNRGLSIFKSVIEKAIFKINTIEHLSIYVSTIKYLELSGSNKKESIINIAQSSISDLNFAGLYNNGLIALRELITAPEGKISFRSSNLGRTDFIYCDFSKAALEFENCKITEAFFSETEFPKRVLVNGTDNYGQAQLVFGQLAAAFQKQGDTIRALEYISRELEAHYRRLKWCSSHFSEKLNLWLNFVSNNFGRDWVRGSLFSFGVGLLFFCLLLISTNEYRWGWPSLDFSLLPAYLKFMNPLRFFELEQLFYNTPKENVIKLNGLSYLADFGGRIFIAYGYYQTIQAFRRFGRK
jgi:uncharacterized protein YjbI with pentapeptide repeats